MPLGVISHPNALKPVGEHFSSPAHSEDDMIVNILQGNIKNTNLRRAIEQKLADKFDTHQRGLNRDRGCMSHYAMTKDRTTQEGVSNDV